MPADAAVDNRQPVLLGGNIRRGPWFHDFFPFVGFFG
jgi:hypothetical protein